MPRHAPLWPVHHPSRPLAATPTATLLLAVSLLLALVAGCAQTPPTDAASQDPDPAVRAVVYRSATCQCCQGHVEHLEESGFLVRSVVLEDVGLRKDELGVPQDLRSCHTTVIEGYFVEGHVPADVIHDLLTGRPAIDGIALPGMPAGAPGMPGEREAPLVILAVDGGDSSVFATP